MSVKQWPPSVRAETVPAAMSGDVVATSDTSGYRAGLSELRAALATAGTAADVADAVWCWRDQLCGAALAGVLVADPEPRLLPGAEPAVPRRLLLDDLLAADFAHAPGPLFFSSAEVLLATYPILREVGARPPGEACVVLPLTSPATPAGALVLVWEEPRRFDAADRDLLVTLGGLCCAELARTWPLTRGRGDVERLRRLLRPPRLPQVPGADLAVRHEPAVRTGSGVGFYDVLRTADGAWRLVAGDVTAYGADAAVLAGLAREAFRSTSGGGPAAALGELDRQVRGFADPGHMMSAVCVDLTRRGRGFTLTVARAGHPPPLVLPAGGGLLTLDVPGGLLGGWPYPEPAERGLELQPGDAVLLCAGPCRGTLVGDPRFAAVLAGCSGRSAEGILEHAAAGLAHHPGLSTDGVSLLVLRVRGGRTRPDGG